MPITPKFCNILFTFSMSIVYTPNTTNSHSPNSDESDKSAEILKDITKKRSARNSNTAKPLMNRTQTVDTKTNSNNNTKPVSTRHSLSVPITNEAG